MKHPDILCPRTRVLLERAGVLLLYLLLWTIAARAVDVPLLLPAPAAVMTRLLSLLPQRTFWLTLGGTLLRTLEAYVLGVALAVLLAALCCRFRAADLLLSPLLSAVRATPVTSFIVLALVWLSSARVPVLTGLLMTLPVVYSAVVQAVRAVDPRLLAAIGLCWKAVVAAEVIGVPRLAVGSRLYEAKIYLETDSLLAWTLTIVLLSVLLEALLRRAARRFAEVRHD